MHLPKAAVEFVTECLEARRHCIALSNVVFLHLDTRDFVVEHCVNGVTLHVPYAVDDRVHRALDLTLEGGMTRVELALSGHCDGDAAVKAL